jgi:RHS repeat-associated protein
VGGLISMTVCSGTNAGTYFPCYDGNGNVMAMVNAATGAIAGNWEYGPFGEVIRATGPMAKVNPFMFSTDFYDWETGKYYVKHRFYDPSTGRFINRDPIEEQGGLNLYGMVGNDPINHIDPLGLMTDELRDTEIKKLKDSIEAQQIPCCLCNKTKAVGAVDLQSIEVSGDWATVAAKYVVTDGDCPFKVVGYYWWNCFRAHDEAGKAGALPTGIGGETDDQPWKHYGWQPGGYFDYEGAHGLAGWLGGAIWDSNHWGWMATVVYQYCDKQKGIMSVGSRTAPEKQYTWSHWYQTWTDFR